MLWKYTSSTVVILKTALFTLSCIGGGGVAPRMSVVFVSPGPVQRKTLQTTGPTCWKPVRVWSGLKERAIF